jgi:hypothetical protein
MTARTKRTIEKQREVFLEALAAIGNVSRAMKAAKIPRRTLYDWRRNDNEFAVAWEQALEESAGVLESEAHRRAVDGTLRPVYQGGKRVGSIREYSDTLLIFLMKGLMPQKYRERFEHSGEGGGPMVMEVRRFARQPSGK